MKKQEFGAGIWHFATYLDRYATDGYGAVSYTHLTLPTTPYV